MEANAFKQLLLAAHAYAMPRLLKLCNSKADAEDAFMEAMYRFWEEEKAGKVKHEGNLSALIYVMAKHNWLMQKRKATRGQLREYATDPADFRVLEGKAKLGQEEEAFDLLIQSENRQAAFQVQQQKDLAFQRAFQLLKEQCRTLLIKSVVEKVRLKELQQVLGFPTVDAVKMAKYRCKKKLVDYFKKEMAMS